jgi:amino acid adenylation domain-containing protein
MLTTGEFVAHLRSLDIKLSIGDGDRLRCSAPKGALTPVLRDELAARKADLAAWLRANGNDPDPGIADATTNTESGRDHEPLSFAQERLWFIDRFQPGGFAYNITGGIRMAGQLDIAALERSLGEVLRRHEPLRTVFATADGQPAQVVTPYREFRLPVLGLEPRPEHLRLRAVENLLVEEGRRPFDLARGPLFRAQLFRLAPDDHLLQLTIHHIVADGWSLAILSRELTEHYKAYVGGHESPLPPLSLRYVKIARRQREWLGSAAFVAQSQYWKDRLTPAPPVLELPADFPRPALQTFNGAVESFLLPSAVVDRLQRLSREHGVTLFMTLFAAFAVILHRYTGLTDIAVGVPIANRTDVDREAVIGLLVNTLVLRADLAGDPSFRDLLLRVRDVALDAYAHQDFPFERLVEMLKPPRDMSHSVLFQVMFIFQNLPSQAVELPGLTLTYPPIRTGTSKTDVTLEVVERSDGLGMYMEYNTDLFKADTVRRVCNHLERLLMGILDDTAESISRLPLLGEAEYHQITAEWNATATSESVGETVPSLLERQVARTPEAPAARFEEESCLSYRDLNGRVNRLAHYLRRHGARRGVPVGVLVERSLDMLIAVLAIMKMRAAYVPLDPAYPADRLEFMLQDAEIPLLVTEAALCDRVSIAASTRVLCLDRDADVIGAESDSNPLESASPDDLAYVIYTSGSTGRPKGVQIAHRALTNVLLAFQGSVGVRQDDVLVALTTLSFDIAGLELLLPLVSGAQVVVASRETAADPAKLSALLSASPATIVQATPTTWRMLLEAGWREAGGMRILCGGEAFPPELAERLLATGASVWNVYGPTETTIWSTIHRVQSGDNPVPIGRPIANTQTYVLDANGNPVPIGVPGELYVGGTGVATGYLKRPELTAERFVPDRFSDQQDARLYRTGDVVRYRADGMIEYLGRVDHQVKVRGFRIELGEVESVLTSHAAVIQAVVAAREDRPGDHYLAAYVRLVGAPAPSEVEFRAFLKERLPEYMIPSTFTELEVFPLTPNGKIDRRKLPEPGGRRPGPGSSLAAPQSELERTIAQVWRDVLRLDEVGVDDNFFDLGGHSLLLVQVQTRLRETLEREVPIVEMFQYPTIRTMAAHFTCSRPAFEAR